ncbi:MAG: flagellar assembly protein FliW [Solirubrobacteraceae bacterium]
MSAVTFQSIRFGTVEVAEEDVIEFPLGLIGLGGRHYALIDRNPGTGFLWLHSTEDEALGLPVVDPNLFFPEFTLNLNVEDRQRIGLDEESVGGAQAQSRPALYVTVRATPDPFDITANLRAPLVIHEGKGYQVINASMQAPLQAPLFVRAEQPVAEPSSSADAA